MKRHHSFYIFCNKHFRLFLFDDSYHLLIQISSIIKRVFRRINRAKRLTRKTTSQNIAFRYIVCLNFANISTHSLKWEEVAISSCRREGKEDTYYCLVYWGWGGYSISINCLILSFCPQNGKGHKKKTSALPIRQMLVREGQTSDVERIKAPFFYFCN